MKKMPYIIDVIATGYAITCIYQYFDVYKKTDTIFALLIAFPIILLLPILIRPRWERVSEETLKSKSYKKRYIFFIVVCVLLAALFVISAITVDDGIWSFLGTIPISLGWLW